MYFDDEKRVKSDGKYILICTASVSQITNHRQQFHSYEKHLTPLSMASLAMQINFVTCRCSSHRHLNFFVKVRQRQVTHICESSRFSLFLFLCKSHLTKMNMLSVIAHVSWPYFKCRTLDLFPLFLFSCKKCASNAV